MHEAEIAGTIKDAWWKAPSEWPGWQEGRRWYVLPPRAIPTLAEQGPDEPPAYKSVEPVEFRIEPAWHGPIPIWRAIGRWRGAEAVVHETRR